MVIQDKTMRQIVLVVKCVPFDDIKVEDYKENEIVTSSLTSMKKGANRVKCNGPLKTDKMFALGRRGCMLNIDDVAFIAL